MIKVSLRRLEEAGELGRALVDGIPGAGLLVLDGDFRILLADGEVHGERDHDAFLMHRLSEVVPPGAWETLGPHLVAALGGEAQSFEYEVVGKPSWHWLRLAPIRDAGAVIGVLVRSQDITTQVSTHRMLADSERLKSSVLSVLDEGVVVVDLDGHLLEANPAARTILGLQREGASQDANWWETLAARRGGEDSDLDVGAKVIATGQGIWDVKLEIDRPDGATVLLSANYLPLRDDHRDVSGLVLSFRDVTARVSEQRRVLELQDRLLEAHQVARLASWEWRSASDDVVVFRALPESEVNSGERASVEAFLALVPDEERQTLREDLVAFARGERDESIRRHRHDLPSRVSWLETRAHAVRDQAGNLTCVRGTSQDVTEQELAKQELARSRDFLQETLDSLTGHVAVLDEQGEIMATNRAWGQFASDNGGDPEQARGNYLAACDSAVGMSGRSKPRRVCAESSLVARSSSRWSTPATAPPSGGGSCFGQPATPARETHVWWSITATSPSAGGRGGRSRCRRRCSMRSTWRWSRRTSSGTSRTGTVARSGSMAGRARRSSVARPAS
jgi:PAS domain S-box-containing protein